MVLSKKLKEIKSNKRSVLAKLLSEVEKFQENELTIIWNSYLKLKKRPVVIGIQGTPGAGKSTFLNNLLSHQDMKEKKIGLILVDPSSPVHGGALLGDRVRLSEHYLNLNFYMRSITNRGAVDGMNPYIESYLMIMCHFPFDVIFIESVGGGQTNNSITEIVDKTLLLFDPSSGDDVQHLKEGVLEVADEIIISKSDLRDGRAIAHSLKESLLNEPVIYPANLLEKSSLDSYIDNYLFQDIKTNQNNLLLSLLKKFTQQFLKEQLDQFSNKFNDETLLTDEDARTFRTNFLNFLKENG